MAREMLKRPDYIEKAATGQTLNMFCKVCGTQIYGTLTIHDKLYAELKMRFSDGTSHITNLCRNCVPIVSGSTKLMNELHKADMKYMAADMDEPARSRFLIINEHREKPRFVTAAFGRGGLI
jgi:hypothetical protein